MLQRFTLDRKSFEEFLAAASFFQRVQRQALREGAGALHGEQPLLVLMETQRAIELGKLDLDSAMERIVGLTPRTVGGSGAAVWLFTRNEFVCGASVGISPSDERLRLQVLSKLIREFHLESLPEVARLAKVDSGGYPGSIKSVLVTPIYQGSTMAGALAAFSAELDPFTDRDTANLRLLAGLLTRALTSAAEAGLRSAEALEHTALLQLVEQVTPALRELVQSVEQKPAMLPNPQPEAPAEPAYMSYGSAEEEVESETSANDSPQSASEEDAFARVAASGRKTEGEQEEEDISVPFVGVRASLSSDLDEPSRFWSALQEGWQRGTAAVWQQIGAVAQVLGRAHGRILTYSQSVVRKAGRAARYRPSLPALPTAAVRRGMRQVQSSAMAIIQRAGAQLWRPVQHLPKPVLLRRALGLRWIAAQLWCREAWSQAGIKLKNLRRGVRQFASPLDLSKQPEADARKQLQQVEAALINAAEWTRARLQVAAEYRVRVRLALPSLSLNRSALRKSVPAWAVLVIMISFLVLELGMLRSWTIAATRSGATSAGVPQVNAVREGDHQARLDSAGARLASEPQSSGKISGPETSHLKVTDPATEAYLSDMTRFEIAALRRRAAYGDGVAAFRLGMAYEVGQGVPQSCTKAAEWVTQAAEDGNAAAEFNLGLRYREGDGVDPDSEEANKWFRKAFAHKYSGAEGALLAMNSH